MHKSKLIDWGEQQSIPYIHLVNIFITVKWVIEWFARKNYRKIHNLNTNEEWLRLKITMPNVNECEKKI